jgi:hypothetical protein
MDETLEGCVDDFVNRKEAAVKDRTTGAITSHSQKKNRLTGARLGMRGVMATALLESGMSIPKVREVTGISQTTAVFLKKEKVMPRAQVDALKRHLQDKFARIASLALDSIDEGKISAAGFGELVRGAALAAQNAGITSPNVQEYYREIMLAKYSIQSDKPQPAEE